jgi:hypothetical protein
MLKRCGCFGQRSAVLVLGFVSTDFAQQDGVLLMKMTPDDGQTHLWWKERQIQRSLLENGYMTRQPNSIGTRKTLFD